MIDVSCHDSPLHGYTGHKHTIVFGMMGVTDALCCALPLSWTEIFKPNTEEQNECNEWMGFQTTMNEWCFRPHFCTAKVILGQWQPGPMRCIFAWIKP